jgi:hypothetical protein
MDPQSFAQMPQLNALLSNGSITRETFDSMEVMVMAGAESSRHRKPPPLLYRFACAYIFQRERWQAPVLQRGGQPTNSYGGKQKKSR